MRMYISVNGLRFVFFINVLILVVSKIDYAIIIKATTGSSATSHSQHSWITPYDKGFFVRKQSEYSVVKN
ncbi:hypothetical protein BM525_15930 [Alteromonas mediterranea]|nr:hypothetical protein BM525_15930 [Alteromonas mediterranea]